MKIKIIAIITVISSLFACSKESITIGEAIPTTTIIQAGDNNFYIKGTIDGQPFELTHSSVNEYNTPLNDDMTSSGRPFFGTNFVYDDKENPSTYMNISFGVTEDNTASLTTVVKPDTLSWYGFEVPSNSIGEAFVQTVWNDIGYTSALFPFSNDPQHQFIIETVEQIEIDENLNEIYSGKVYKVTGSFKITLDDWNNDPNDNIELIVDEFSALFYDNF